MQLVKRLRLFDDKFDLILLKVVETCGCWLLSLIVLFNFYLVPIGCDVSEHDGVPRLDERLLPDEARSKLLKDFVLNSVSSFLDDIAHHSLAVGD